MSKLNELRLLLKAVDRLQGVALCNSEVMDDEDLSDLKAVIGGLQSMYHKSYKEQLTDFIGYLNTTPEGDDEWKEWTEQPYVITHGMKTVVVDNYADVYQSICELLEEHLKDLQ